MARRPTWDRRTGIVALLALYLAVALGADLMTATLGRDRADRGPGLPGVPPAVAPTGTGVTREVWSAADWGQVLAVVQPGDVIRLKATIPSRLAYQGGGSGTAPDGTAEAPIVVTADPGVWIDPGNLNSNQGALDLVSVAHVHVVGVNVRNAQFGIRCLECHGSPGKPVRIAGNRVTQIGHAGIHVAGHWQTHAPSWHVVVEGNVVSATGRTGPPYGEGVYLGYGSVEWIDTTSDVTVRDNDISDTTAEGVDIKPGTRNILVEGNRIHDLSPINGGAISAHYVNVTPNPRLAQLDQVVIRNNHIWNLNLNGASGANDWAIWVGHGGVDIIGNTIWGLRGDPAKARAVRVRATQPFGPHPIRIQDNVFWTAKGWLAEGSPSGAANVQASGNRGVDPASVELVVAASAFSGPVPAIGTGGTADGGSGPGSGFQLAGGAPAPAPTTTVPAPAPVAPPGTSAGPPATTTPAVPTSRPASPGPSSTAVPTGAAPATSTGPRSPTGGSAPSPQAGPQADQPVPADAAQGLPGPGPGEATGLPATAGLPGAAPETLAFVAGSIGPLVAYGPPVPGVPAVGSAPNGTRAAIAAPARNAWSLGLGWGDGTGPAGTGGRGATVTGPGSPSAPPLAGSTVAGRLLVAAMAVGGSALAARAVSTGRR